MPATTAALADALRAVADAQAIPGFVAATVERGALSWALCHGVTDIESPAPVTLDTRFPMASVTKVVTAAAVLTEVERGALSLEAPAKALLPDIDWADARAERITLAQLLSHTAGLDDIDPIAWTDDAATDDDALARAIRAFAHRPLLADPGSGYRYSNAGYDVAGLTLARAAGTSFEDAARARVLAPLGTEDTSFYPHPDRPVQSPPAVGHVGDGRGGAMAYRGPIGSRSHAPCGTLAMTAVDAAKLVSALADPGKSPLPAMSRMATRIAPTGRTDGAWAGLGVRLRERSGETVVEHGGWDPGFRCAIAAIPARRAGALVLTNFHWSWPGMMEAILNTVQGIAPGVGEAELTALRAPPPPGRG